MAKRVQVRLNHITQRFRVAIDGVVVGRVEQIETVQSSHGRPVLVGSDAGEHDADVRVPVFEIEL
jgi:hypothetical protein